MRTIKGGFTIDLTGRLNDVKIFNKLNKIWMYIQIYATTVFLKKTGRSEN